MRSFAVARIQLCMQLLNSPPHFTDVFAIMGVRMFCDTLPSKFGSMYTASFTLFQLITLDDWFELYDEIRATTKASSGLHDGVDPVFTYFFVFIVTENFIFVNLFTAVIVNNLEIHQQKQTRAGMLTSQVGGEDMSGGSGTSESRSRGADRSIKVRTDNSGTYQELMRIAL